MKKKTGKFLKSLIVILGAAIISVVMCGCSSATTEEKLVGAWKKENSSETFLTIYDDGTYEQAHRLQCEKDERQKRRQQKSGLDRRLRPILARDVNTTRCP